jgi:NAD(P)-dependent dehydrogenase (short-subunit alcohol dehydrogenase family)
MSSQVAVVFGAGPRIGKAVAERFISAGYRVATVSRSASEAPTLSADGRVLSIRADLSQSSSIPGVFATVKATFGAAPKVVVWNAASGAQPTDPDNMFTLPAADFEKDLVVAVTAPWAAAAEAFKVWGRESKETAGQRTYIYTGNLVPTIVSPRPGWVGFGTGKTGALHWLKVADLVYRDKGIRWVRPGGQGGVLAQNQARHLHLFGLRKLFPPRLEVHVTWVIVRLTNIVRFFYADGRLADGSPDFKVDAEGHANMYFTLAEDYGA